MVVPFTPLDYNLYSNNCIDAAVNVVNSSDRLHRARERCGDWLPKGAEPLGGRGSFNDPVTGEQRVLVHGDHAHVNDPEGNRVGINGNKVDPKSPEAHLPIKPPSPPPQP